MALQQSVTVKCHTQKTHVKSYSVLFYQSKNKHPQENLHERCTSNANLIRTNLFAVFRVGEVNEVIIVHLLCVDDVTVLLLAQVLRINAVGSQELLVSDTECLSDGLSDKLGLQEASHEHTSVSHRSQTPQGGMEQDQHGVSKHYVEA